MCVPVPAVSHVTGLLETYLPHLRPAQQRGVAAWVSGVLAAGSGCEAAVLSALEPLGLPEHATRARLREVLRDGADRAAPCAVSLEVETCFAPLLAWVVDWWTGTDLPLAIDATSLRDREVVLRITQVGKRGLVRDQGWVVQAS